MSRPKSNVDLMWLRRIVAQGGEVPAQYPGRWGSLPRWYLGYSSDPDPEPIPDEVVDRLYDQGFIAPSKVDHGIVSGFKVTEKFGKESDDG